AAAWIDRSGDFHWAHPDAFDDAPATATVDSDADLIDLSWSNSINDVFSRVYVTCMDPTVTASDRADVALWTGSGDTIPATPEMKEAGQHYIREIASAPSGTDWFAAKIGPYVMGRSTASKNDF